MSLRIYPTHPPLDAVTLVEHLDGAMQELEFVPAHDLRHIEDYRPEAFDANVIDLDAKPAIRSIRWDDRCSEIDQLGPRAQLRTMYFWRDSSPVRRYFKDHKRVRRSDLQEMRELALHEGTHLDYVKVGLNYANSGNTPALKEVYLSHHDGHRETLFILKYLVAFLIQDLESTRVEVEPKHAEEEYFVYENSQSIAQKVPWW
jgi:hypothetical protein